jgi:anti-sigma factor RsiW
MRKEVNKMNACEGYTVDLQLYLDDELGGGMLREFLAHLRICGYCRASLEEQLALSAILRESRPLYSAPPKLRARVTASLLREGSDRTTTQRYESIRQGLQTILQSGERLIPRWTVLAPAVLGITLCLLLISNIVREVRASEYVEAAVSTHLNYLTGHLPLEIRSDSPQAVTGWLAGKVPFPFQLPDSQRQSGSRPAYRLLGATLVSYRGSQAGLVTYDAPQKDAISLLVASTNHAVVAGGVEVRSGDLVFHHRIDSGFQVITWSNHGLAYALVSRVAGSAQGSCLVCHQNMADRDTFRPPS